MDLDLFCNAKIPAEVPNVLSHDLLSHFNLQKLCKEHKKKKQNRALQIPLKEIVSIEQPLKPPDFHLSLSEKQQLFS